MAAGRSFKTERTSLLVALPQEECEAEAEEEEEEEGDGWTLPLFFIFISAPEGVCPREGRAEERRPKREKLERERGGGKEGEIFGLVEMMK